MGEAKRKKLLEMKESAAKESGIVRLENGLLISEELRDSLRNHDWSQGSRNPRDPKDNPDEWTTSECQARQFSGFRVNKIMNQMEGWILGRKAGHIPLDKCTPGAMASFHEELFKTAGSVIEIGEGAENG